MRIYIYISLSLTRRHALCAPLARRWWRKRSRRRTRNWQTLLGQCPGTRHFPEPAGYILSWGHAQKTFAAHAFQRLCPTTYITAQIAAPDKAAADDATEDAKGTGVAVGDAGFGVAVAGNGVGDGTQLLAGLEHDFGVGLVSGVLSRLLGRRDEGLLDVVCGFGWGPVEEGGVELDQR